MTVEPLEIVPDGRGFVPDARGADVAPVAPAAGETAGFGRALSSALDAAGGALVRADAAERAFASGRGGLQEMVLERAQADVALSLATAAASRATQSLSTILGMQI